MKLESLYLKPLFVLAVGFTHLGAVGKTLADVAKPFGIQVTDNCVLSQIEILRFDKILAAYDSIHLIRGTLKYLSIGNAPTYWEYGERPWSDISGGGIHFFCVTSGKLPKGSMYKDIHDFEYYFSHELGHLFEKTSSAELFRKFSDLNRQSRKAEMNTNFGNFGDFITDYASSNVHEDWAETFRSLVYASQGSSYVWNREFPEFASAQPILAEKLALIESMFESFSDSGVFLIKVWPDGEVSYRSTDDFVYVFVNYKIKRYANGLIEKFILSQDQPDPNFHLIRNPEALL